MKRLKERIEKDGKCFPGGILKVDKFINHQMDPNLMKDIAVEFIRRFAASAAHQPFFTAEFLMRNGLVTSFHSKQQRMTVKEPMQRL